MGAPMKDTDDPGDFTVEQVLAHLNRAKPGERIRVLNAERLGKNRITVVDAASPSVEERKGMRGHDEQGNVRPADGRFELHDPKHESKYVRTERGRTRSDEETAS